MKNKIIIRNINSDDKDAVLYIHKQSIYKTCKDYYTEKEMKIWTDSLTPKIFDKGIKDKNNIGLAATLTERYFF